MKKTLSLVGILFITCSSAFSAPSASEHPWLDKQLAKQRYACPPGKSPFKGPEDAPVTIVEFVDYDCSFCAQQEETMKEIMEAYPTQVKLVIKALPLDMHPHAKHKAQVAMCMASQGKFWQAHERFLHGKDQKEATKGVDAGELKSCVAQAGDGQVDRDLALAKKLGLVTTPAFVVDGIRQGGTIGFKQFKLLIDAEIARKSANAGNGNKG